MFKPPAASLLLPLPGRITRFLAWSAIALTAATLAWLINGLDRGLELTDESFYLLSALHPDSIRLFSSATHWVSGALWQISGSLFAFRALGLGLATASAMLLAWGVLCVAPRAGLAPADGRLGRAAVVATSISGALLYGSFVSFTPSYNLLGASGACFAVGLGLMSIADDRNAGRASVLAALAGLTLGITVLCKFSTGLCTAGLLLVLQAVMTWKRPGGRLDSLLMVACAFAAVGAAMLGTTGVHEAIRQFRAGLEILWSVQGDKTTSGRLVRSALDIGGMLAGVLTSFGGPLACFALGVFWRPVMLGCLGAAWFAFLLARNDHLTAGVSRHMLQALPLAAALGLVLLINIRRWTRTGGALFLVFTLAALPLGVALGTSNPLQVQILGALAPWGALIGLLAFSGLKTSLPGAMIGVLFCLTVLLHIISNGAQPYRLHALTEQIETVAIPDLGKLKVDTATAALVRGIKSAAEQCGIKPGAPFLDFYNLPGVALMIGARPVETPWLFSPDYADRALKRADPVTLRSSVVAVKRNEQGEIPRPPAQLEAFPRGFSLCGSATDPIDGLQIELWAPSPASP